MSEIVRAEGVTKYYGDFAALSDVSFSIQKGSITGLIGPNGAGKTTTLKAILGLTDFKGELSVLGNDPRRGRHHIMEQVCFIADVGVLPRWMRVDEVLKYVEGVHPRFSRERAEQLLAETDIRRKHRVRELSKGMVTQLHLAVVMAIDVELLVLDEPTLGLDILYRKAFYDRLLNDYFDRETSIIISTHQVEEIESLLTHLLFIAEGSIVLETGMDELPEHYGEVLVGPEKVEAAMQLGPLYVTDMLGKKRMLFENTERRRLEELGEVHVPSVADLFVAKMQRARS
jgi:ABC-2 type transport system ATP-binding protein